MSKIIERVVNIFWNPDEDEPTGHVSIFRSVDESHIEELTKPSQFNTSYVAQCSPLACPLLDDLSHAEFCEQFGIVPTWIE
jgi:hypothetical protein